MQTKTLQMLQEINLGADTRIIVPYATPQDNTIIYRAWYGTCQINYRTANQNITLYDDNNEHTAYPIVFLNDRYRNRLVAIFQLPNNDDVPRERPFLRVEIVHHYCTKHFDAQGPIFITTQLDEPEL